MTYFHNSPDGYQPVTPTSENLLFHPAFHATPEQRAGLFYRTDIPIDRDEATERLLQQTQATIQDYQYWVDTGWKVEHGTYAAVERFGEKLYEEHQEFASELRQNITSKTSNDEEIISEAGDTLWCATALASVAMADIDSGIKNLLFRYVLGIQHVVEGHAVEPTWRSTAAAIATKYEQLTISDITTLLHAGFEPLPSPVMNIFDPGQEPEYTVEEHLIQSLAFCATLRNEVEAQFGWNDNYGPETKLYIMPGEFQKRSRHIGEVAAQIYLEVAWMTVQASNTPLEFILATNVTKLTKRVATNTVDKTDGPRSQ